MNIQHLEMLAKDLEAMEKAPFEDFTFDMQHVLEKHKCGTVGCIAGWVLFRYLDAEPEHMSTYQAATWLGLADDQRRALFFEGMNLDPTPGQCAKVVRHLIATGEINWGILPRKKYSLVDA
jgi:hypothetical protein